MKIRYCYDICSNSVAIDIAMANCNQFSIDVGTHVLFVSRSDLTPAGASLKMGHGHEPYFVDVAGKYFGSTMVQELEHAIYCMPSMWIMQLDLPDEVLESCLPSWEELAKSFLNPPA